MFTKANDYIFARSFIWCLSVIFVVIDRWMLHGKNGGQE